MALLTTTIPPRRDGLARFDGVDYVFVGGRVAVPDETVAAKMVATGLYDWDAPAPVDVPAEAPAEIAEDAEPVKPKAKAKK